MTIVQRGSQLSLGKRLCYKIVYSRRPETNERCTAYEDSIFTRSCHAFNRPVFLVASMGHLRWWRWWRNGRCRRWRRPKRRSSACCLHGAVEDLGTTKRPEQGTRVVLVSRQRQRAEEIEPACIANSHALLQSMRGDDRR